jgi:hypothetical protein
MAPSAGAAARCMPKVMIWKVGFALSGPACELLAIMDIRARSISFATPPRRPEGAPDYERAETFLHLLISTRRPRWQSQLNSTQLNSTQLNYCFAGQLERQSFPW